jgi:hypothetical protein
LSAEETVETAKSQARPRLVQQVGATGDDAGHGISGNGTRYNNEGVGGAFPVLDPASPAAHRPQRNGPGAGATGTVLGDVPSGGAMARFYK